MEEIRKTIRNDIEEIKKLKLYFNSHYEAGTDRFNFLFKMLMYIENQYYELENYVCTIQRYHSLDEVRAASRVQLNSSKFMLLWFANEIKKDGLNL